MTLAPPPTVVTLTRADHGRRMTIDEFDAAEVEEGILVELAEGVVEVSDVPSILHAMLEDRLHQFIDAYRTQQPSRVRLLAPGSRAKLQVGPRCSTRHPDLSIYLTDPPAGDQPWVDWIADIVVEIVSESSRRRDYVSKMVDYLQAGVSEYWIVDPQSEQVQVCRREAGKWHITVLSGDQPLTTDRLPGFTTTPAVIFGIQPA